MSIKLVVGDYSLDDDMPYTFLQALLYRDHGDPDGNFAVLRTSEFTTEDMSIPEFNEFIAWSQHQAELWGAEFVDEECKITKFFEEHPLED